MIANEVFIDFFLFLASGLYLIIGYFLLFKGKNAPSSTLLAAISISSAFWTLGIAFFRIVPSYDFLFFLNKEFILSSSIIASSFLHFALIFSKKINKINLLDVAIIHFPNIIILLGLNIDHYFIESIVFRSWGRESILGWAYIYFGLYIVGYFLLGLYFLLKAFLPAKGEFRMQLGYILTATIITGSIDIFFNLILILFGNYKYIWIGPYSSFIWVSILAFTITKHELMDIKVIIGRNGAYGLVGVLLTTSFVLLNLITWPQSVSMVVNALLALIWAWGAHRLRDIIQTPVDKWISWYKADELINSIVKKLGLVSEKEEAFKVIAEQLKSTIKIKKVGVSLGVKAEYSGATKTKDGIVIPLSSTEGSEGVIILGQKESEDPYDKKDFTFFETLIIQAKTILDRVSHYETIKRNFESSQKKLYDTERLLARSERIASMTGLIQEYNHEIRTPLNVMSTYLGSLPDDAKAIDSFIEVKEKLMTQIRRAADIVDSTLRLSKPKERKEVSLSLNDVINDALKLYQPIGVKLVKKFSDLPVVCGDYEDLKLVFINLIKNASEAITGREGQIMIKTYLAKENDSAYVCAEVADNGSGIAKEKMEKIFEPFFSTHVTKGRGLGLSIVFRIIREHLGGIKVESEPGKGSQFTVNLPVKR